MLVEVGMCVCVLVVLCCVGGRLRGAAGRGVCVCFGLGRALERKGDGEGRQLQVCVTSDGAGAERGMGRGEAMHPGEGGSEEDGYRRVVQYLQFITILV
ncbi:hypothetical protein T492DRAFT_1010839 [Pavlovales sp. CCMP2436]|nr:hypothetical protein T492DRAFT_1010839 [Pavlovales sp. CCMP2436]